MQELKILIIWISVACLYFSVKCLHAVRAYSFKTTYVRCMRADEYENKLIENMRKGTKIFLCAS